MDAVFMKLLNMSIAASWLILAVIVLRFVLKKAPKWMCCALWALVGLRLLLPFSLKSAFSLIPSTETIPQDLVSSHNFDVQTGFEVVDTQINDYLSDHYFAGVSYPIDFGSTLMRTLGFVWLMGVAVMLIYAAVSYLRMRRKVVTSLHVRDAVWICDDIRTPFILGVITPRIYLPSGMEHAVETHVIAHETAHLKRRDHWWKLLGYLLLAVYWYNPLCWLAYILLCRDIELACDERVIRSMDKPDMVAYSEALLLCSAPRHMKMACPLAFGEVGVTERIKTVLNYRKPAFWIMAVAAAACVVVVVCFLTDPKADETVTNPFGRNYSVESIVYTAAYYSFAYTPETAPDYQLTSDRQLKVLEDTDSGNWQNAGVLEETALTSDNFDSYIRIDALWFGTSAETLRRENQQAWRVIVSPELGESVFYYILLQKDGSLYLTYGYYDLGGMGEEQTDDSSIRWVFQLGTASTTHTGGTDAPAQVTAMPDQ